MSANITFFDANPIDSALEAVAVKLNQRDDVAIAKQSLPPGSTLRMDVGSITTQSLIASAHKVALRNVLKGQPVRRYGQIIGFASRDIVAGDHVHTHNLSVHAHANAGDANRDYAFSSEVHPLAAPAHTRYFNGFKRPSGRVGTRNYLLVLSTVNCSAFTSKEIAKHFDAHFMARYPNVDGVIAITHGWGCGLQHGGENYQILQKVLAGFANHANVGGFILVGLGCEGNQVEELVDNHNLTYGNGHRPLRMTIQDRGGIRATIKAGIEAVEELLPMVDAYMRTAQPISELNLALECGGSDAWSGVTANPALGEAADRLVAHGGTACLAETTEIYGAEHLLTRRAISREVGEKLLSKITWWEKYTSMMGIEIDNNPSPGNKAGGLTTIYEKSLGAVAKGGSAPLMDVFGYAEPITTRGFVFMDTPGYDPVEATGQVAGGCNLLCFTTGRGSVFGFRPTPSIKICTNSATYEKMREDMDMNAGKLLDGVPMSEVADELFELLLRVASGEKTKSEQLGIGEDEFQPWNIGGTL